MAKGLKTTLLLDHVQRVSRSFYLPIRALPPPYLEWIALSYLALRILDTIEDSHWRDSAAQRACFEIYEELIRQPANLEAVAAWSKGFPASLTRAEALLIEDSPRILAQLHALPAGARAVLQRTILTMSRGMQVFLSDKRHLTSLAELDLYCFLVAGIVAELLVDLLAIAHPDFSVGPARVQGARHFGVALQKINILRDAAEDRSRDRSYFRDKAEVMLSLAGNAQQALEFFARLPPKEGGFRLFCQTSLLLALSRLKEGSSATEQDMTQLVEKIRISSSDSEGIDQLAQELCPWLIRASRAPSSGRLTQKALETAAPSELISILREYFAKSAGDRKGSCASRSLNLPAC